MDVDCDKAQGMAKKPAPTARSVTLNLRVTEEVHAALQAIAAQQDRPLASLLNVIVKQYVAAGMAAETVQAARKAKPGKQ
jgi:predicted HicB family RNase H-like nuclease